MRLFLRRTASVLSLLAALAPLSAQTPPPPAPAAPAVDPAKAEALHQRYEQGVALAQQGKLDDALAVFQGIIKEAPDAKGSLAFAGIVEMQLGKPDKALDYLNPLYAAAPDDFRSVLLLLQANQALGRDIRVQELRKKLLAMHGGATPIPGLTDAKSYAREKIADSRIEVTEFFDYHQDPLIVWEAVQYDAAGKRLRDFLLAYNADATTELRKKSPSLANTEVFLFGENVIKDGAVRQFNLYRQETELPDYPAFRKWTMDAIKNPPKPIFVQPMQ